MTSSQAPVLEMRGIRKTFPGVVALDGIDLDLCRGEVHMLLGENGAGKSTLMKVLSGAHRMDAGEIRIDGRLADIREPGDALALGIRIIYQELNLVPQLSAAENIFLGRAPTRWPGVIDWRRLYARATHLLRDLGMQVDPRIQVGQLSLAHQQMVEIARALSENASILVMDEPTSALTSQEVTQLFALIERLVSRRVAIVYITHRFDEVFRIGHRVTVLRDGKHVTTRAIGDVSVAELVRLMANRELTDHFPKIRVEPGRELLRADRIGRGTRLRDISFSLRAGEVVGIAGLLGAGRTELARAMAGADRPDTGRLFIKGEVVSVRSPADAIRCGIGFLPEERKTQGLVGGLSVARNIALPHASRISRLGFLRSGTETALARPLIDELCIKTSGPAQPAVWLSGGNQQKVVLAKWLAGDADIFIFDEPTRGIDVGAKVEIYHLMNRLTARGAGIIMISSELPEILGMSDRILVMYQGRLQAELSAAEATEERVLTAALGLAS